MKKEYICPHCKAVNKSAIQWQTISIGYDFDLKTGNSEEYDREGGEHEAWVCPECGNDLPEAMEVKIEEMLGW